MMLNMCSLCVEVIMLVEIEFTPLEADLPWVKRYKTLMALTKPTDDEILSFISTDIGVLNLKKTTKGLETINKFKAAKLNLIDRRCIAISEYEQLKERLNKQKPSADDDKQFTDELKGAYIEAMAFKVLVYKTSPLVKKASQDAETNFENSRHHYIKRYREVLVAEDRILKNKYNELQETEAKLHATHTTQQTKIVELKRTIDATIRAIREDISSHEPMNAAASSTNDVPIPPPPPPLQFNHQVKLPAGKRVQSNTNTPASFVDELKGDSKKRLRTVAKDARVKDARKSIPAQAMAEVKSALAQAIHFVEPNVDSSRKSQPASVLTLEAYAEKLKQQGTKIVEKMQLIQSLEARNASQVRQITALTEEVKQLDALKKDFKRRATEVQQVIVETLLVPASVSTALIAPPAPPAPPVPVAPSKLPSMARTPQSRASAKSKTNVGNSDAAAKKSNNPKDAIQAELFATILRRGKALNHDIHSKDNPAELERKRNKALEEERTNAEKLAQEQAIIDKYTAHVVKVDTTEAVVDPIVDSASTLDELKTRVEALLTHMKNKRDTVQPGVEEENTTLVRQNSSDLRNDIQTCLTRLSTESEAAVMRPTVDGSEDDVLTEAANTILSKIPAKDKEKLLMLWANIQKKETSYDVILMEAIKGKTLTSAAAHDLIVLRNFIVKQANRDLSFAEPRFKSDLNLFYNNAIEIILSDKAPKEKYNSLKEAAHNDFRHRDSRKRLVADTLLLLSCFVGVGLVIGGARKLNGNSFFFSTANTKREEDFVKRLVRPV